MSYVALFLYVLGAADLWCCGSVMEKHIGALGKAVGIDDLTMTSRNLALQAIFWPAHALLNVLMCLSGMFDEK